jgi:hypothetical protein
MILHMSFALMVIYCRQKYVVTEGHNSTKVTILSKEIFFIIFALLGGGMCVTYRRVLDCVIGLIVTLYSQIITIINYSVIDISTHCSSLFRRRDSVIGTATGYGLDDGGVGVRIPVG